MSGVYETNVSRAISVIIIIIIRDLMTEMVLEMLVSYRHLTQLIAQEDFIEFSCWESSRLYIYIIIC